MDGKDASTTPPAAPQPGAPSSSPLTHQAMEGNYAAASSPQPGEPQPAEGAPPSSPLKQHAMEGKDAAASSAQPGEPQPAPPAEGAKWGTREMGPPAAPGAHPENQQAAQWTASRGDQELPPYVIMGGPVPAPDSARRTEKGKDTPMEHILDFFNIWSRKAEELSSNIWLNRKHFHHALALL